MSTFNLADLLSGGTPELLRTLLMTPSAENTGEFTVWKSPEFPGWSLSLPTPDIAALLGAL